MNDQVQTQATDTNTSANAVVFNFRNPQANVIKANADEGLPPPIKRQSVSIVLPLLDKAALLAILNGDNLAAIQLVVDQANMVLVEEVREQLDSLPNYEEVDVTKLDMSKVDFISIANQPKATRSGGISDDLWAEWAANVHEVFAAHTDRTPEQVTVITNLLQKKLREVNKSEKVLKLLETYLNTWFTSASEDDQNKYVEIYKRLSARIENYLSTVNEDPAAALGLI